MHRKDPRTAALFFPDPGEAPKKDDLPIAALAWLRAIIRREFPDGTGAVSLPPRSEAPAAPDLDTK